MKDALKIYKKLPLKDKLIILQIKTNDLIANL